MKQVVTLIIETDPPLEWLPRQLDLDMADWKVRLGMEFLRRAFFENATTDDQGGDFIVWPPPIFPD